MGCSIDFENSLFVLWFAKLCEDACCGLWMKECYGHLLCSRTWSLVNEADALALCFDECFGHSVFHSEGYVMNSLASLFEPLGYGRLG